MRIQGPVAIYRSEGQWVAHCLPMDVLGDGNSPKAAINSMVEAISAQVAFAHKNGLESKLYRPAPQEYWEKCFKNPHKVAVDIVISSSKKSAKQTPKAIEPVELLELSYA